MLGSFQLKCTASSILSECSPQHVRKRYSMEESLSKLRCIPHELLGQEKLEHVNEITISFHLLPVNEVTNTDPLLIHFQLVTQCANLFAHRGRGTWKPLGERGEGRVFVHHDFFKDAWVPPNVGLVKSAYSAASLPQPRLLSPASLLRLSFRRHSGTPTIRRDLRPRWSCIFCLYGKPVRFCIYTLG